MNPSKKRFARTVLLLVIVLLLVMTFLKGRWEGLAVAGVLILHFAVWEFLMFKSRRRLSARQESPEDSVAPENNNRAI